MFDAARRILARVPSYAVYTRERPAWVLLLLFGRLNWARRIERAVRARPLFEAQLPVSADILSPEAPAIADRLKEDGVCEGFALAPQTLQDIRKFAEESRCYPADGSGDDLYAGEYQSFNRRRSKDILSAYYFSSIENCDAIKRLMVDPKLLCISRNYLGQDAINIRTRLWWSFPARRYDDADLRRAAQDRFHSDLNDWRTIKFFFYLTDVDEDGGPHAYVATSHRKRSLRHQYTIFLGRDEEDLESTYGRDKFRTVFGKAGSGFAEDPFVFHTGGTVRANPRLILELEFGSYEPSPSYRYGLLG